MDEGDVLAPHFLSHWSSPVAPDRDRLESTLRELARAGQAAWPELKLPKAAFVEHLAAHTPRDTDAVEALAALHATDLFLACACARADPCAISLFEARLLPDLRVALGGFDPSGAVADEVGQILCEKLFVGGSGAPPKIADYSGRGPLRNWVRVMAVRAAIKLRRGEQRARAREASDAEELAGIADAELQYMQSRYRTDFRRAMEEGFAALSSKERNLLRLSYIERLSIDQIGALYSVHRSTASRWVVRSREVLVGNIRAGLERRLQLADTELESLIGALRSHLDVSIRRLLEKSGA
jgi:RNA polymerase sigma-70 factor (ECF subfamily)